MKRFWFIVLLIMPVFSITAQNLKFSIVLDSKLNKSPVDGRLLLMISNNDSAEPRFQIGEGPSTQLIFGVDVNEFNTDQSIEIDKSVFGFPVKNINDIPKGEYFVQALLHKYEMFNLSNGKTVKLPMDRGEGQQWNKAPGNYYSTLRKIFIDPKSRESIKIVLDKIIPPVPEPAESKYVKYVKIQSKLLSEFWGRPIFLAAFVLIPYGFDEHPDARYPLVINHGHFPTTISAFRENPPDTNLVPDYSERFHWSGYNKTVQEYSHKLFKEWTSPEFPRMLLIEIQHANPYYDDSYAVNSANLGPYGDAITFELIPYIEKKFRGIGKGWSRFLYGGSTGGWESLAAQIFYPDEYNGCWAACPDPIDFRAYTVVDIYRDKNAYYLDNTWKKTPRPGTRNYLGHISATLEEANHLELVLGENSRSGGQWDIWQAVFSPVGNNGYPRPIWNKLSGEIDSSTADYWKENFDLRYILERDWKKLGNKLKGKIHIYVGEADNFYLNNAVYLMEDFLRNTKDPYYDGEVDYGARAEHCWNGDHDQPNAISRLRYAQMYFPRIVKRILDSAPEDADLTSWRY
ncbi:MAG: hypothetical protein CVV24_12205 [Ignavibacteriae bacterium HGW-Ignavibacteriae-3]|nr:MAG: hypothetical protein CVV24_12205 [Ignavibacteriae bacterium HGW-Ignavibacteriae-3]